MSDVHSHPAASVLREVTVFANGDPDSASTWSNIPYFLTHTLRRRIVRVNTVSLAPRPPFKLAYDLLARLAVRVALPASSYAYFRTPLHRWDVRRRIERAVERFPRSQCNLFLTFSFSGPKSSLVPSVLVCDWPYSYHITHFLGRGPDTLERHAIATEVEALHTSRLAVSLFAGVARALQSEFPSVPTKYFGHVINTERVALESELLPLKSRSNSLLFIGGPHYKPGALQLVEALNRLRPDFPDLRLDVIGMTRDQLGVVNDRVTCHGYLDKSTPSQADLYDRLLRSARAVVNPTPKWSGFSSLIESMYFFTPVVTTPFNEFTTLFGAAPEFAAYCDGVDVRSLEVALTDVIMAEGYERRCRSAHENARAHTWDHFVDELLKELSFASPGSA